MKSYCSYFALVLVLVNQYVHPSEQFETSSIGRVVRGHLGTLYDLRNKLGGSASIPTSTTSSPTYQQYKRQTNSLKKESRANAFYYSASDVSHPTYSVHNQDFQSRIGKVSDYPSYSNKWKNSDKGTDKYAKLSYKMASSGSKDSNLNSFNVHWKTLENNETTPATMEVKTTSLPIINPSASTTTSPSSINAAPLNPFSQGIYKAPMKALSQGISTAPLKSISQGIDTAPLKSLVSQGFNSAVTQVLTQKLMNLLDQDSPPNLLNPFRHLVASGNRMVEFWDKRTAAREGKAPGVVEVLGYGLDQLKQFRDGQELQKSDIISNHTSASKTLIQGMLIIKKLTNRVLGYDTDDASMESRGGYGDSGGGWGWGHQVSYGGSNGGLELVSLLGVLAFGAFLLQMILTITSTNARSLDVSHLNTPMMMSDSHVRNLINFDDKIFGTPTLRSKRATEDRDEESLFSSIVDKLDGVVKAYQHISDNSKFKSPPVKYSCPGCVGT